tara:strand:- start:1623 stop:2261 length:639 start_codon:yes stop_codon:yes gene_type:complete
MLNIIYPYYNIYDNINLNKFLYFTPIYILLLKLNEKYSPILFYTIVTTLSLHEIINNKMYIINTNLNEYNYFADIIRLIASQYFFIELINDKNIVYKIHHSIVIIGISTSYIFNKGYTCIIYLSLTEISTIFLVLKEKNKNILIRNLFYINFFIFRIMLLPYLFYNYYYYTEPYNSRRLILTPLFLFILLHVYWIFMLFKKIFLARKLIKEI